MCSLIPVQWLRSAKKLLSPRFLLWRMSGKNKQICSALLIFSASAVLVSLCWYSFLSKIYWFVVPGAVSCIAVFVPGCDLVVSYLSSNLLRFVLKFALSGCMEVLNKTSRIMLSWGTSERNVKLIFWRRLKPNVTHEILLLFPKSIEYFPTFLDSPDIFYN